MICKAIKTSLLLALLLTVIVSAQENKKIVFPEIAANFAFFDDRWIGISGRDVEPNDLNKYKLNEIAGVIVIKVSKDSPASKAGIQEDDVILEYDNQKVMSMKALKRMVTETPLYRKVTLSILRNGKIIKTYNKIKKREWDFEMPNIKKYIYKNYEPEIEDKEIMLEKEENDCITLGIEPTTLTKQLRKYFNAPDNSGILVASVYKDSLAEKSGLQAGDVIIKINDKSISKPHQLRSELCELNNQKSITLTIIREKKEMQINVNTSEN